jgi:lipoprotein-anchoring transpeptidase ErfK/SrfK
MIRTFPFGRSSLFKLPERWAILLLAGLGVATALVVAAAGAVYAAVASTPPGLSASVADAAILPLNASIGVVPEGWDARLESATLWETPLEEGSRPDAARQVPVRVDVLRAGWQPGETEVVVRPASGSLRPDASYRLTLRGSAQAAALPWPDRASVEREVHFTTSSAPLPLPTVGVTQLAWAQPLQVRWSQPIESFRVEVTPSAATRSWVGPDRRTSHVAIDDPREGTTYQIRIVEARGSNGIPLQRPATFHAAAPPRPRLVDAEQPFVAEPGAPVAIRWSMPIKSMAHTVSPPVDSKWELDRRDPTVARLRLDGAAQGTRYEVRITEAVAQTGAPLAEPQTLAIETPKPLTVAELLTGTNGPRVSVQSRPVLVFDEPVRDRRAAERAIVLEPSIAGGFEWIDDRQVRFLPARALPYDAQVTFRVKPGPDGARSVGGGYLEEPAAFSFRTEPNKLIDVDVTRQVMTLSEGGRTVRSLSVATGVPGADTPIGEFFVQYKMPVARFQGVNVNGSRYDIPDVKWVIAFLGDYTIHGAYWRGGFGRPGSNGCVSLTDADAKIVFDWAPEGTPIRIHY